MRRVVLLLAALTLSAPGLSWASCQWMVDPGAIGDVISAMNLGSDPDTVTYQIFDNTGVQQGGTVTTAPIKSLGRLETTVGNLYRGAHLPNSAIQNTYILATEGTGREIILQVNVGGGGSFQPLHFDSDFDRVSACDQR